MWYWIITPFLLIFSVSLWRFNKFHNRFKAQGGPANKLSEKEIELWKNKGLSGEESGRAYNNGWTDPNNPLIEKGKISFYSNYQQSDKNINPARVNREELNTCYQLLNEISQDNSSNLDYNQRINQLDYWQLPSSRQRESLLRFQGERKWNNIYQHLKEAEIIEQVNQETPNINSWQDDFYFVAKQKTKSVLIRVQNDKLNDFLSGEQRKVLDLVMEGRSIFFTGSAGTGKSFLLQRIVKTLEISRGKEAMAITATTGIAAVNIGGVTIHSFSGIGIYGDTHEAEEIVNRIWRQRSKNWINNWLTINTLIIDEISMFSGKVFDKLEYIARKIRSNNHFFGGLQLILSGDFFQLPPVKSKDYCFEASSWKKLPHAIILNKIYRQTQPQLVKLLNEIRFGEISEKSWEILKSLEKEPNFPDDVIKATKLVATNDEKDAINTSELVKNKNKSYFFKANDWEDPNYKGRLEVLVKDCLAVGNLELKRGCQVMLIWNLSKDLVNGSQGVVVDFNNQGLPIVKFENGMKETIREANWEDITPIRHLVRARRTQIPLVLGWAMTIHKSQGQSIKRLSVNLGRIFERGQAYVALSRACSLEYLQVIGFARGKVICDEKVKNFYKKLIAI